MRFPSLLLAVALLCGVSAARGAPGTNPEPTITLALDGAPLTRLVSELARQSGIKHQVVKGDAQLVAVFCKDQPVSRVRSAVTDLLGWKWSRTSSGEQTGYTLIKPPSLTRHEAELRARFWQQYAAIVDGMVKASKNPPEARTGSPLDFQLRDPLHGGVLQTLGSLPPPVKERILNGKPLSTLASQLTADSRSALHQLLKSQGSVVQLQPDDILRLEVLQDARGRPSNLRLGLWQEGKLRLQFDSAQVDLALVEDRESRPERREALRQVLNENPELQRKTGKRSELMWPMAPEPSYVGWQLRELSLHTDLPLMADCYPAAERETTPIRFQSKPWEFRRTEGQPLYQSLEQLRDITHHEWRVQEGWVLLRYEQWFWEPMRGRAEMPR